MLPILLLALGTPSGSSGRLIWTTPTGTTPYEFALADRGGQVTIQDTAYRLQIFSSFDTSPPVPAWTRSVSSLIGGPVASRASGSVLYVSCRLLGPKGPVRSSLQLFTADREGPLWTYGYAPQYWSFPQYDVSDDGSTIVSAFSDENTYRMDVRVHDPETGEVRFGFERTPAWVNSLELSSDGSTLAITTGIQPPFDTLVFDLATGSLVFETSGSLPRRQGLSKDGKVLAVKEIANDGIWHLRAFLREASGYRPILDEIARPDLGLWDVAVSDDGSTLAAGWFDHRPPTRAILRAFDLASGSTTMEKILVAASLDNIPSDLAICDDGSRFVVGLWGDAAGRIPELQVFARDRNDAIAEYGDWGSVREVDISPDGDRFVATRSDHHCEAGYYESRLEMYELGGEDLVLRGRPSIGTTPTLELHGTPSSAAFLLAGRALAPNPIDYPGVGTLYLAPGASVARPLGAIPSTGVLTFPLPIPNLPSLVGARSWYQALETSPRALSRDFVQLTILP